MNHREGSHAFGKLERRLSVEERQQQHNTCFNEELLVFTNRVVRAENARAKYSAQTCEYPKHQGFGASQTSSSPPTRSPQTPDIANKGVERIVLQKVYYAMRNSSDEDEDLPSPSKHSQDREQDNENVQRGMRDNSDGYFSGNSFKNSSKCSKKVHETKYPDRLTGICPHRQGPTEEVRGFSRTEHEQQSDQQHCCSTPYEANHSMSRRGSMHTDFEWDSTPSGFETPPPSSESSGESGVNFAKLRSTVENAVLEEIRRQIGSTGGTGEAQILARVARDILLANTKDTDAFQTQAELVGRSGSARKITGPIHEEHACRATRQEHQVVSQFSTAIDGETRPTTTAAQLGNYGYPEGTVIRMVHTFNGDKPSKRPGSLRNDHDQGMTRSKYARKEGMSGLITNGRFSPDTTEDACPAEEVMISPQRTLKRQLESINQDADALENYGSLRAKSRNSERDGEAEFQETPDEKRSTYLQAGRDDERSDSNYSPILSEAIFRFRRSSENGDELCEDSEQPSPSSDDSLEIYRPSFVYDVHLQQSRSDHDSPSHPEATRSDHLFDSVAVNEGSSFPSSIFKHAQSMRQDIHATVRVFSAMFQPFSCSQKYSTSTSQQSSMNNPTPRKNTNQFARCSETSQTSTSVNEGSSGGSKCEHQMGEVSSRDYRERGEHDIQITSVCSLQKDGHFAQNNVQRQRRELMAESACKSSTITEGGLQEKACAAAEKSPPFSCSRFPIGSCTEEMIGKAKPTEAVYPPACLENLSDNSSTGEEMAMQTRPLPDELPTDSKHGIPRQLASRQDVTLIKTEEAEGRVLLKEIPSYCDHSHSKGFRPSRRKITGRSELEVLRWSSEPPLAELRHAF